MAGWRRDKALMALALIWSSLWLLRAAVEASQQDWAWSGYSLALAAGGLAWLPVLRRSGSG